jgi:hypothetical protein
MVYVPPTKSHLERIGRVRKQTFTVETEIIMDDMTCGEGKYYARDIKECLKRYGDFDRVSVIEVKGKNKKS